MPTDTINTLLARLQSWSHQAVPAYLLPVAAWFGAAVALWLLLTFIARAPSLFRDLREPQAFLEVTPPQITAASPESTAGLFSLVASLLSQRSLADRLLFRQATCSFEIASSREGGIRYLVRVPEREAELLEKGLRAYLPGLTVCQASDYLPEKNETRVTDFRLARHFALPLSCREELSEHDPLAYLAGQMVRLREGELMAVQVVLRPLRRFGLRREAARIRRLIRQDRFRSWDEGTALRLVSFLEPLARLVALPVLAVADALTGAPPLPPERRLPAPEPTPAERETEELVKGKLSQPLFEASVRTLVVMRKYEAVTRERGLRSSFAGFLHPSGQSLRPAWRPFPALSAWRFARRLPGPPLVLSCSEVGALWHFPLSATTQTEDLARVRSRELPAPLSLKNGRALDTVFASSRFGGADTAVGLTLEERRRHVYVLGATGSGKTTLLSTMVYRDILAGKGLCVVDPHGQLVERLLAVIPRERLGDVVWFAPDDDGYPVSLNLLDLPKGDGLTPSQVQKRKSLVASSINSIFQKLYDARYFGPRMEYILRNAILTALETESPTLLTVQDLLTKPKYRKSVVATLRNPALRDFWTYEFERLGTLQKNQAVSPITNKIGGLLSSPLSHAILTQPTSRLDFGEVMDQGKILLCDLSKGKIGEDETAFFGSLIIAKLQLAALSRARIPEAERRDFVLYVDEFQNFATRNFAELVSEARKYRLSVVLAHQSVSQVEDRDVVRVILANVGTAICFRTANPEDEQFVLPIFAPEVAKHEISNLPPYHFYAKVMAGMPQDAFKAEVADFTVPGNAETARLAVEESRKRYAAPISKIALPGISQGAETSHPPGTVSEEFPGSDDESSSTYPIQEGSSVGVGKVKNSTQQQNKTPVPTLPRKPTQPPPITPKQQEILLLLYRFRFLTRTQIQSFLNHKSHRLVLTWLNDLTGKQYVEKTGQTDVPSYFIATNGIGFLAAQSACDPANLKKLYRENERTPAFVARCRFLADIAIRLREEVPGSTLYTRSEYFGLSNSETIIDIAPDAYVSQKKGNSFFLEILEDGPLPRLRQRVKRYFAAVETGSNIPAIRIICPSKTVLGYLKTYVRKLRETGQTSEEIDIRFSVGKAVREKGIDRQVWE